MSALLRVEGLNVRYRVGSGWFTAVEGFELSIPERSRVAVVGESGSGKTTACMALTGLLPADAEVTADALELDGTDLLARQRHAIPHRIPGLSVVFQNAMGALDPVWTVQSQMTAVLAGVERISRKDARERAADWLRRVGLHDTKRVLGARPYELSGGMRQRVMIALALCSSPRLLVADEPTSALDMTLSKELMELIVQLSDEVGSSLLMISHDIGLCRAFTDWTVVMHHGRIVEQGPSEIVTTEPTDPYTRDLVACVPSLANRGAHRLPTMAAER